MSSQLSRAHGECRCAQVQFRLASTPLMSMACHCTGCQRMTGSAFSLSVAFPTSAFTLTRGEPVVGGLHGAARHWFCPHCMSWLYTQPSGVDFLLNVRATLLDTQRWSQPFIETYTCEKLEWIKLPAVHSFERFPPAEAWEPLMREYAASAAETAAR